MTLHTSHMVLTYKVKSLSHASHMTFKSKSQDPHMQDAWPHLYLVSVILRISCTSRPNEHDGAVHGGEVRDEDGGWLVDQLPVVDLNVCVWVSVCGKGLRLLHSQTISTTLLAMLKVVGDLCWPFSDGLSYTQPLRKAKKQGEMTTPRQRHFPLLLSSGHNGTI